jgi:hypothetical protein
VETADAKVLHRAILVDGWRRTLFSRNISGEQCSGGPAGPGIREITDYRSMGVAPLILAGALAAGAVASLCLTLAASVRRRRAGLALLKTLGLTGRQLATTAACQSTVTVAADALIGVRLGIALGRYL